MEIFIDTDTLSHEFVTSYACLINWLSEKFCHLFIVFSCNGGRTLNLCRWLYECIILVLRNYSLLPKANNIVS